LAAGVPKNADGKEVKGPDKIPLIVEVKLPELTDKDQGTLTLRIKFQTATLNTKDKGFSAKITTNVRKCDLVPAKKK
jgi:hypothetical protein